MNCLVKLTKTIETPNAALNHYAVGWAFGVLAQQFEKNLYRVKSLTVKNRGFKVEVTAVVGISFAADEGNESEALAEQLSLLVKSGYSIHCCSSKPRFWGWDTAERVES